MVVLLATRSMELNEMGAVVVIYTLVVRREGACGSYAAGSTIYYISGDLSSLSCLIEHGCNL